MTEYHIPIMRDECMEFLQIVPNKLYLDGTLGGGGHSYEMLLRGARVVAIDRDIEAIDYATSRFNKNSDFNGKYRIVKDNFKNVLHVLDTLSIDYLDGAILDLGISSHQIDAMERGFSYKADGTLDMRMDRDQYLSALSLINEYTEEELSRIIYTYGEERFARRIAKKIVEQRKISPIESTQKLVDIIKSCVPFNPKGGHPAKKTFQAIRIEVNNELSGLGESLCDIVLRLKRGARLCVITFHSLEDRIVKQTFRNLCTDCICDKSLPICVCKHKAVGKLVETKGIKASEAEVQNNSRSKSATLRILEKL